MKIAATILAALLLVGAATSAIACSGNWKQTTAQNSDKPLLPPQDARS